MSYPLAEDIPGSQSGYLKHGNKMSILSEHVRTSEHLCDSHVKQQPAVLCMLKSTDVLVPLLHVHTYKNN